jgi:hypothetical protein
MWTYKDLKSIPLHLTQHRIELNTNIHVTHQAWYWMNLNSVAVMKYDLDKLLVANIHSPSGGANLALSHCGGTKKEQEASNTHGFSKIERYHKK